MLRVTDIAHLIVRSRLRPGAIAVDATVGNGHDTLMLADAVGPTGRVFGFDIQPNALVRAQAALDKKLNGKPGERLPCTAGPTQANSPGHRQPVTLFEAGHERMAVLLPAEVHGQVSAAMFNLGYLPGAPKHVTTSSDTTVAALMQAVALIAIGGLVTVIVYPGHPGGAEEADAVRQRVALLPSNYCTHTSARLNSATPAPELLIIERLR